MVAPGGHRAEYWLCQLALGAQPELLPLPVAPRPEVPELSSPQCEMYLV